jgi:hypothetical protein
MHRLFRPAVAVCALGLTGAAATAVPAQAASSTVALTSHVQSVKTSTGKSLKFMVTASQSAKSLAVSLSTGTSGSLESHSWSFALTASSFTFNGSTGKMTVKTGKQIAPFGTFNLSFTKSSQSTKSCASGSTQTIKGSLKGIAYFVSNTGKSGWGNVGSPTKTYTFSTPSFITVTTGEGCFGGGSGSSATPCTSGITWYGPGFSTFGTQSGSTSTISVFRSSKLSKPAKASRTDILTATGQPAPKESGGAVHVTTKSGARWSGSAQLAETNGFPFPDQQCTLNGVTHVQHTTTYSQAPWTSPSSGRLKADFRVTPDWVAPTSGTGNLTVNSYS